MQVVISPKFQIVIPKEIRDALHLQPGEKLQVFCYQHRLEFIPIKQIKSMRGFLKGMSTDLERDDQDRI